MRVPTIASFSFVLGCSPTAEVIADVPVAGPIVQDGVRLDWDRRYVCVSEFPGLHLAPDRTPWISTWDLPCNGGCKPTDGARPFVDERARWLPDGITLAGNSDDGIPWQQTLPVVGEPQDARYVDGCPPGDRIFAVVTTARDSSVFAIDVQSGRMLGSVTTPLVESPGERAIEVRAFCDDEGVQVHGKGPGSAWIHFHDARARLRSRRELDPRPLAIGLWGSAFRIDDPPRSEVVTADRRYERRGSLLLAFDRAGVLLWERDVYGGDIGCGGLELVGCSHCGGVFPPLLGVHGDWVAATSGGEHQHIAVFDRHGHHVAQFF